MGYRAGVYTLPRTEVWSGEVTLIEGIRANLFVNESLLMGAVYTYTVSDGNMASNLAVIDLSAVFPLEHVGNHSDKVIVLKSAILIRTPRQAETWPVKGSGWR